MVRCGDQVSHSRRAMLRTLTAAVLAGTLPHIARAQAREDIYAIGRTGNVRLLHQTDTHGQFEPVLFREPSVNIGVGDAAGRPPHLVGKPFLDHFDIPGGSARAYALTCLDFEEAAHRYGRMGGFAHAKTLIDRLRDGGRPSEHAAAGRRRLLAGLLGGTQLTRWSHGASVQPARRRRHDLALGNDLRRGATQHRSLGVQR